MHQTRECARVAPFYLSLSHTHFLHPRLHLSERDASAASQVLTYVSMRSHDYASIERTFTHECTLACFGGRHKALLRLYEGSMKALRRNAPPDASEADIKKDRNKY